MVLRSYSGTSKHPQRGRELPCPTKTLPKVFSNCYNREYLVFCNWLFRHCFQDFSLMLQGSGLCFFSWVMMLTWCLFVLFSENHVLVRICPPPHFRVFPVFLLSPWKMEWQLTACSSFPGPRGLFLLLSSTPTATTGYLRRPGRWCLP